MWRRKKKYREKTFIKKVKLKCLLQWTFNICSFPSLFFIYSRRKMWKTIFNNEWWIFSCIIFWIFSHYTQKFTAVGKSHISLQIWKADVLILHIFFENWNIFHFPFRKQQIQRWNKFDFFCSLFLRKLNFEIHSRSRSLSFWTNSSEE